MEQSFGGVKKGAQRKSKKAGTAPGLY